MAHLAKTVAKLEEKMARNRGQPQGEMNGRVVMMGRRLELLHPEKDILAHDVFPSIQVTLARTLFEDRVGLWWGGVVGVIADRSHSPMPVTVVMHLSDLRDSVDIWACGIDYGPGQKRLPIASAIAEVRIRGVCSSLWLSFFFLC